MRRLLFLIISIAILFSGCGYSPLTYESTSQSEPEAIKEMFVLAETQYIYKNGDNGKYVLYEYSSDGLLIKEHHWSTKPTDLSTCINYTYKNEPLKGKISEVSYSYYETGVLKETITKAWRNKSWTTSSQYKYDENGLVTQGTSRTDKHTSSHTYKYSYDNQNRIIKKVHEVDGYKYEYLYDYSTNGKLIKETCNYWSANIEKRTETQFSYSEDGLLTEKTETETKYDRKKVTGEQHAYSKYEWTSDKTICTESIFKNNKLYIQYERHYDLNGNILLEKNVLEGAYTEYTYEWLPDYINRIKEIKKQ